MKVFKRSLLFLVLMTYLLVGTVQPSLVAKAENDKKVYYDEKTVLTLLEGINSIDDIDSSAYEEKESINVQDLITGDLMVIDDNVYIYIEKNPLPNVWKKICFPTEENKSITLEEDDTVEYSDDNIFYHWDRQAPVYEVPSNLEGTYGDTLATVSLPKKFKWSNENIKMQSAGEYTYAATYTPDNLLKYKEVTVLLNVKVNKKSTEVEAPKGKITVTYTPGINLDMIPLPKGWSFVSEKRNLEIGENKHKAVFESDPNYSYVGTLEKDIKVVVKKGVYNITGATITAFKGDILTDDMLPDFGNGKLSWDLQNVAVYESGSYKCTFYPADTEHYDNTTDIMVQVNVLEKSQNATAPTPVNDTIDWDDETIEIEIDTTDSKTTASSSSKSSSKNSSKNQKDTKDSKDTKSDTEKASDTSSNTKVNEGSTNNAPSNNNSVTKDSVKNSTEATKEKEEDLSVTSVSNVTEKDIKKTTKKSSSSKKTNVQVKDLKVTKTTKDTDESSNKVKNIDLANAATKSTTEATTEKNNQNNNKDTNKIEKSTENADVYTQDPSVEKKYEAVDLKPGDKKSKTDEKNTEVKWDEKDSNTDKQDNGSASKVVVVFFAGIAAVIGIGVYLLLKKNKLK